MKRSLPARLVIPIALVVLAAPGQVLASPALQMGGDWRKMTPEAATTKAVEAMVLKNDLIHAEVRGNFAVGYGETAAVVVHAVRDGDGCYVTVVAVSTADAEAERLRNAVRTHVFDGPYDDKIPNRLDTKKPGRKSAAPAVSCTALQLADDPSLYRAVVRSGLAYRGLDPDVRGGLVFGTSANTVACVDKTRSATGKANILIVVASSKGEEAEGLRDALAGDLKAGRTAPVVNLTKDQTAIRDQGARDACPYFPPVAALEAAYRRTGVEVDLSVEHLIWLRNVTAGGDGGKRATAENLVSTLGGGGLRTSFDVLKSYAVCPAKDLPYRGDAAVAHIGRSDYYKGWGLETYDWSAPQSQFVLNRWNLDPRRLPPAARADAKYGIDEYVMLSAEDAKKPAKFEQILASGREIVFSIRLHENSDDGGKGEPVWRYKPDAAGDSVNHLMLVVGYDRKRQFFIVKNSWGPTNYTAMKDKLAPNWKDVEAYNGYTLVDYNYLAVCSEAGYISAVAPVGSPRFAAQRALGQWRVAFEHKNRTIMTGVLAWRRGAGAAGVRVGDLVTEDGRQFRVNAKLEGDGTKPYRATLAVDFTTGTQPYDGLRGSAWSGELALPADGRIAMTLDPAAGDKQKLWGAPAEEVRLSAQLVADRNLLRAMKPPAELLDK